MIENLKKYYYCLILFGLFNFFNLNAQKIVNIQSQLEGNYIIIKYDLVHTKFYQEFNISVYYSADNGLTYKGPLRNVMGDVGKNVLPGKQKTIKWEFFKEGVTFNNEHVVFKVDAEVIAKERDRMLLTCVSGNLHTPFGLRFGIIGKTGFYLNTNVNQHFFKKAEYEFINNEISDYNKPEYYVFDSSAVKPKLTSTAGLTFQTGKNLFLYAGAGYSFKKVYRIIDTYSYSNDNFVEKYYLKDIDLSRDGLIIETGGIYRISKYLVFSIGATYDLEYVNWLAGIGINF